MSAYVVNTEHIDVMVKAGRDLGPNRDPLRWYFGNPSRSHSLDYETETQTGAMLLAENYRSVNYRYTEQTEPEDYTYTDPRIHLTSVEVLKAISCYEYQACECPDWEQTEAYSFCRALESAAIDALPGYQNATRDWSAEEIARRPKDMSVPIFGRKYA